ncbi:hypothetical protein T12_3944 [Trichinella patagoniensis]|uniref:Uncharacterized protein n=1 Tax=Trichinella patagoniensis TaxID=990121 RepID=A0A0V0YYG3_9BILA|nr:hypothetical protein T12_3944 [Trichinella patagoniensis]
MTDKVWRFVCCPLPCVGRENVVDPDRPFSLGNCLKKFFSHGRM